MIRRLIIALATTGPLAGCATYRTRPLILIPPLKPALTTLTNTLPNGRTIRLTQPLSPQALSALAVLNDPTLAATRARARISQAHAFAAGLLPDPNLQGGFGALLGGPAVAPSIAGSITQDIAALITRGATIRAADASAAATRASILWQEWQVASRAQTLDVSLWSTSQSLAAIDHARIALTALVATAQQALASGNVTIGQAAVAQASLASLDATRNILAQRAQRDHAALAALLGVMPTVKIDLARPIIPRLAPRAIARLSATLADRRPDLIALRYGYRAADADLRAAILAQFPLMSLTINGASDTSRVATIGPTLSLNLPLFNDHRGAIGIARASRRQLQASFTAALATAQGNAAAATQALALLRTERTAAIRRLVAAQRIERAARSAERQHLIDALIETNLIDQAATRQAELINLDAQIAIGSIAQATLLGAGLPADHLQTRPTPKAHS